MNITAKAALTKSVFQRKKHLIARPNSLVRSGKHIGQHCCPLHHGLSVQNAQDTHLIAKLHIFNVGTIRLKVRIQYQAIQIHKGTTPYFCASRAADVPTEASGDFPI